MNEEAIDTLIAKNPRLKTRRDKLQQMQPGRICLHRSWGIGRINAYDELEGKLIIDFDEDKSGHPMDPAFCVDRLEVLPENHIIVRQRNEPDVVEEMIKKRQVDLVIDILATAPEQSATNTEIERLLARLLGPTRMKKWWSATKKLLVKDPRVAVPSKKTEPYVLRDEPIRVEDEVLEEFYSNRSIKKQIDLAEKLLVLSVKHEDIKEQLPDILQTLTSGLKESRQLNPGQRLHGIWVRNDLARFLHDDPEQLAPTSKAIIEEEAEDLPKLASMIPATHYKRFLDLIYRSQPESWEADVFDLLRNSMGKFTNECIAFLMDKDCAGKLEHTLNRWLNEQALKEPILHWMVKNRNTRKFSKMLHPMMTPRLFNALLYAIDYEALQNATNRRIPLAEFLSDDVDIISELLAEANPETARDLATMMILNQGFEELTKNSILARFIRLFPSVQNVVSGSATQKQPETSDTLYVSEESRLKRQEEYEELIKVKIPENKVAIAAARELGDLRENAEYKMARQDQDALLARKSDLEADLDRARPTDFSDAPTDVVGIGSVVELEVASTGKNVTYSVLGAWDSAPEKNFLSYQTPLARSLVARKVGDSVTTVIDGNEESYTIRKITRFVDR